MVIKILTKTKAADIIQPAVISTSGLQGSSNDQLVSHVKVFILINEIPRTAVLYRSCCLNHSYQSYHDNVALEMQNMDRQRFTWFESNGSNGKDAIPVIERITRYKCVCDALSTHEIAAVFLSRNFVSSLSFNSIKVPLYLSCNFAYGHEGIFMSYVSTLYHQLSHYTTDLLFDKTDEKLGCLKRSSIVP